MNNVSRDSAPIWPRRRSGGLAVARGLTVAATAAFGLLSLQTLTASVRWWVALGATIGLAAYFALPALGRLYLSWRTPLWLPTSALPLFVADTGLWFLAVWTAYATAELGDRPVLEFSHLFGTASILVGLLAVAGTAVGIYRGRWRVGSFGEFWGVAISSALTIGTFGAIRKLTGMTTLDGLGMLLTVAFASAAMVLVRALWRTTRERELRPAEAERILLYGAGRGASVIIPVLKQTNSTLHPVAIIDDDPAKRYRTLDGVRVAGTASQMAEAAAKYGATSVLIAVPSAESDTVRAMVARIEECGLRPLILPKPAEIMAGAGLTSIRDVTEADLLGRRIIETDVDSIAGYLAGKRVLITGAGGSIGSELAKQVGRLGPAAVVLLDRDESALHGTLLAMTGQASMAEDNVVLCDIRDLAALTEVFAEHRPDVVFHAAALKHVPMLERYPDEAYKTNVLGTRNVLTASTAFGVQRFINISTDKAADPINVLGFSKRIAERLTAGVAAQTGLPYVSVRFGNVLGSRGSMLITFRSQIESGGPVTVTHPEATRYFMMIEEAVELTIQAGAIGRSGEVLVLDMGAPIRIADVAELMVRRAGKDIAIEYTGLRPGEKVHEILFAEGEQDSRPLHPAISHTLVPGLDGRDLNEDRGASKTFARSVLEAEASTGPIGTTDAPSPKAGDGEALRRVSW